ncbi:MAG: DUF2336 domain-containing protein [Proteobacteria bacterium]|nr:DUF2336 domain-containing protein [Pseudomonadota bacterium]
MTDEPVSMQLTQDDVAKLMADPSSEVRAETTAKIASQFTTEALSPAERRIAEDIFRKLVKDVELRVREALASHLKNSPDLPHDVAMALAKDVDSVSLPMIKFSEVLTDEDLIEIVRDQGATKQVAVAQRPSVSPRVADALVDTGNEKAVARLVANDGAKLTEKLLGRVMDEYEASDAVSDSLARRPNMPAAVSAQLVEKLTERLQDFLLSKHDVSPDVASNLILQARERATMSLVDYGSTDAELDNLIEQLFRKDRLTPSLLLRSVCMGDINFFERAIARLADLPLQNARILIHDQGSLGLESIYMKADLPKRLFPAFRAGIELVRETDYDGGPNDRSRFIERMLERILTQFEDPQSRMTQEDIDYLMGKLEQVAA